MNSQKKREWSSLLKFYYFDLLTQDPDLLNYSVHVQGINRESHLCHIIVHFKNQVKY